MATYTEILEKSLEKYKNSLKTIEYETYDFESVIDSVMEEFFNKDIYNFACNTHRAMLEDKLLFNGTITETYGIDLNPNPVDTFYSRYHHTIDKADKVTSTLIDKACTFFASIDPTIFSFLNKENQDLIKDNTSPIYFPQEYYTYTNLRDSMKYEPIIVKINRLFSGIRTNMENIDDSMVHFEDSDDEEFLQTRKHIINSFFEYYGMTESNLVAPHNISAEEVKNRYNKIIAQTSFNNEVVSDYWFLENDFGFAIKGFESMLNSINLDDYHLDSYRDSDKLRKVLMEAANRIDKYVEAYLLGLTVRLEAIMGYITTNNAIITETINQLSNTYSPYIVPNDVPEDVNNLIDWQNDLQEVQEALIYNETALDLEAAGLITLNEETKDQIAAYFNKIIIGMQRVIEKIQTAIRKKISEQLTPVIAKLKSSDKPDPTFNITNAKQFDFTKLDSIQPEKFQYELMKESLKSRDAFIERYYPELRPTDKEKSIYKIMLNTCMIQVKSVTCTSKIIDDYTDFLTKGYVTQLEGLPDFVSAIDEASKQAVGIAQTIDQNADREVQQVQAVQQQQAQQQPQATGESVEIISEVDRTKFEDTEKAQNQGQGDTNLMRASTLYCTIMSQLLSSRIKVLNFAYNDRLKIVMHYVVKNKFNKKEEQQK